MRGTLQLLPGPERDATRICFDHVMWLVRERGINARTELMVVRTLISMVSYSCFWQYLANAVGSCNATVVPDNLSHLSIYLQAKFRFASISKADPSRGDKTFQVR